MEFGPTAKKRRLVKYKASGCHFHCAMGCVWRIGIFCDLVHEISPNARRRIFPTEIRGEKLIDVTWDYKCCSWITLATLGCWLRLALDAVYLDRISIHILQINLLKTKRYICVWFAMISCIILIPYKGKQEGNFFSSVCVCISCLWHLNALWNFFLGHG